MIWQTLDCNALNLDILGDGPDVVFQHGLCGDRHQPAQVFPDGFRRLTLECRGHGGSDAGDPEQYSLSRFTDDLAAMIVEKGLRPIVGGISMGAAISLRLAVTRPDLVRALVIARPAWATAPAPANMAPMALVGQMLSEGRSLTDFDATDTARRFAEEAPDNLASLHGFFSRAPRNVTAALLTRLSADGPGIGAEDLAALDMPVLVVGHGRDLIHPLSMAQELARAIPRARFVEITPKASDPVAYATDFRAALGAFLGNL